jgi:periplasmic protein TonB
MTRRRLRVVVRFRAIRSRLARFVGGSAAAHGVLLAVVLIVPLTRQHAAPIQDTMTVALAGPIGGAGAPPARSSAPSAPAKAAPAPAPKEAHTVREVPVPKAPKPKEKPDKPKKDLPKAPPTEAPESPEASGQTSGAKPDAAAESAGQGTGAASAGTATGVTASVGGGDAALGWYGAAVKAALESAWAKPYLEDQGQTFSVVVAFDIARDGSTRNVRIVTPSGVPSLDRSVLRAVIEASPLPAVPPTWKDETLPATMRFDLNPDAQ